LKRYLTAINRQTTTTITLEEAVAWCLMYYRMVPHSATLLTPSYLVMGYDPSVCRTLERITIEVQERPDVERLQLLGVLRQSMVEAAARAKELLVRNEDPSHIQPLRRGSLVLVRLNDYQISNISKELTNQKLNAIWTLPMRVIYVNETGMSGNVECLVTRRTIRVHAERCQVISLPYTETQYNDWLTTMRDEKKFMQLLATKEIYEDLEPTNQPSRLRVGGKVRGEVDRILTVPPTPQQKPLTTTNSSEIPKITRLNDPLAKKLEAGPTALSLPATNEQLLPGEDDEEELLGRVYEVEKIIGHEERKGGDFFKVKWKGYGVIDDSWEPEGLLEGAQEAVLNYKLLWNKKNPKNPFFLSPEETQLIHDEEIKTSPTEQSTKPQPDPATIIHRTPPIIEPTEEDQNIKDKVNSPETTIPTPRVQLNTKGKIGRLIQPSTTKAPPKTKKNPTTTEQTISKRTTQHKRSRIGFDHSTTTSTARGQWLAKLPQTTVKTEIINHAGISSKYD
jgi:hypothetical protein